MDVRVPFIARYSDPYQGKAHLTKVIKSCIAEPHKFKAIVITDENGIELQFQQVIHHSRCMHLFSVEFEPSDWQEGSMDFTSCY